MATARPFKYKALCHQLNAYLIFQSAGLYRMKGLVWVEGPEKAYIIQSVGKRLGFTERGEQSPLENRQSRIVFIGKNLQRILL